MLAYLLENPDLLRLLGLAILGFFLGMCMARVFR